MMILDIRVARFCHNRRAGAKATAILDDFVDD